MLLSNLGYKEGSLLGFQDWCKEGYNSGLEDCLKPGQEEVLTKIADLKIDDVWTLNTKETTQRALKMDTLTTTTMRDLNA